MVSSRTHIIIYLCLVVSQLLRGWRCCLRRIRLCYDLDKVVGEHSNLPVYLSFPPALIFNLLADNSDDLPFHQSQLILIQSSVRKQDETLFLDWSTKNEDTCQCIAKRWNNANTSTSVSLNITYLAWVAAWVHSCQWLSWLFQACQLSHYLAPRWYLSSYRWRRW